MNVIPDKKLIDAVCEGLSDEDKAGVTALLTLLTPTMYIDPRDLIPLQEIPPQPGLSFYMDYKYGKK